MLYADIQIDIAGRTFLMLNNPVGSNTEVTFAWDGLDAFNRPVTGETQARVGIFFGDPCF